MSGAVRMRSLKVGASLMVRACVIDATRGSSRGPGPVVVGSGEHRVAVWMADDLLEGVGVPVGWVERSETHHRNPTSPPGAIDVASAPKIASMLRERGIATVCITAAAHVDSTHLHWLDAEHARGWIDPADDGVHADSDGAVRVAQSIADALDAGFVGADAVLLAFAGDSVLPRLSWGAGPTFTPRLALRPAPGHSVRHSPSHSWRDIERDWERDFERDFERPTATRHIGLYAIVDSARQLRRVLDAGVRTVQLRIKRPPDADARWEEMLRAEVEVCVAATRAVDAELILNDHWKLAAELGITAVHLGQEDLLKLGDEGRAQLIESGVRLGISSHSVWELCRARSLDPRYIACGPVWPTTTKDMPWVPQGPDNLAWWCEHAGAPVVAIGGILEPDQARIAARAGADGVCLVRALGDDPALTVPAFEQAVARGRGEHDAARTEHDAAPSEHDAAPSEHDAARIEHVGARSRTPRWPHPTLPPMPSAPSPPES